MQKILAFIILVLSLPFFGLVYFLIKVEDGGDFFFKQKRIGKNKKPFVMYKFRTMVEGAEKKKVRLLKLNEVDGPVFKIRNDPRFTKVGKYLSHTGLDELPQLVNIVKGEMAFIGPRPLPTYEDNQVPKKYDERYKVLPGITSPWVIGGTHKLTFKKWMNLDVEYAKGKNFLTDAAIFFATFFLILKFIFRESIGRLGSK